MRWLLQQFLDFLAYWALPFLCFVLPARAANALAGLITRPNWLFRQHAANALANVSAVSPPADPQAWQARFRLVRFLDAVDTWHGHFSSDRRIARSLVTDPETWPEQKSLVLLGTHLGPSTLLLRRLAAVGYRPRFVFRDIPPGNRRSAPLYHAYLAFRIAYLRKVCRGGEIRVPGGRDAVSQALEETGTALILLVDAPAERPRGAKLNLYGHELPVDPGGLAMVVEQGTPACRFAMYWDACSGRRVIELAEAGHLLNRDQALMDMSRYLETLIEKHPAQWQLWLTAQAVLASRD